MDRVAGGAARAAQALLIIWLAGGLSRSARSRGSAGRRRPRRPSGPSIAYLPPPTEIIGEIASVLDESGLPDVFVGLEPVPLAARRHAREPRRRRDRGPRPPKHGPRRDPRLWFAGDGDRVLVATGYLVTNAHVVAGASHDPARARAPATADATVVMFDPRARRRAALRARASTAPALRFAAEDPSAGPSARRSATRGGGPLVVLPAGGDRRVRGATGRDIYDADVVPRDILELRAEVEPGRLGRAARARERHDRRARVRGVARRRLRWATRCTPTSVAVRIAPAIGRTGASTSASACAMPPLSARRARAPARAGVANPTPGGGSRPAPGR